MAVVLAAAAFAACASSPQYSSASGTIDLADHPVPSLSASELTILRGMADATVLGNMVTADSLAVVTADTRGACANNSAAPCRGVFVWLGSLSLARRFQAKLPMR